MPDKNSFAPENVACGLSILLGIGAGMAVFLGVNPISLVNHAASSPAMTSTGLSLLAVLGITFVASVMGRAAIGVSLKLASDLDKPDGMVIVPRERPVPKSR